MTRSEPNHSKISPTACLVAYWRKFSDVPYAKEVGELINAQGIANQILSGADLSVDSLHWLAPMIEARYKCIFFRSKA